MLSEASNSTKENNGPIANIAQAISSTAKTDCAQDVLLEVVFDSNVARAVSSNTKKDPKKRSKWKKPKKVPQSMWNYDSSSDEDMPLGFINVQLKKKA